MNENEQCNQKRVKCKYKTYVNCARECVICRNGDEYACIETRYKKNLNISNAHAHTHTYTPYCSMNSKESLNCKKTFQRVFYHTPILYSIFFAAQLWFFALLFMLFKLCVCVCVLGACKKRFNPNRIIGVVFI